MSIIVVYHDAQKAIVCCDDRISREDPATLLMHRLDGRVCKIVVLPHSMVLGTTGRHDLCGRFLRGILRMTLEHADFGSEKVSAVLSPMLRLAWSRRHPIAVSAKRDAQSAVLVRLDREWKIRCHVFRSENDFAPIETTGDANNRLAVLGGDSAVDEAAVDNFAKTIGLRGRHKSGAWVASHLRALVNEFSARHFEEIGEASWFAAIGRHGPIELPGDFPSPELEGVEQAVAVPALAGQGRFYVGSIRTPRAGAPDTIGNNDGGNGPAPGTIETLRPTLVITPSTGLPGNPTINGNATVTDIQNVFDGDANTFAELELTGDGNGNSAAFELAGFPAGNSGRFQSLEMGIVYEVVTNSMTGGDHSLNAFGVVVTKAGGANAVLVNDADSVAVGDYSQSEALDAGASPGTYALQLAFQTSGLFSHPTSGTFKIRIYDIFLRGTN